MWPLPHILKSGPQPPRSQPSFLTCLSRNSRASFSMWPSYKFVVRLMRPILERPKSVSLMCPMDVIRRLGSQRHESMGLFPGFPRVLILTDAKFSHSGFYRVPVGLEQGSFSRETGSCERKGISGFVSTALCTSSSLAFCPFPQLINVYCPQPHSPLGTGTC